MRVLLLPSWYATPRSPVLGTFFEEQARALMALGARVGVLHPVLHPFSARFDSRREPQPPDVVDDGLPTHRAFACAPLPRLRRPGHWALERAALAALRRHADAHGMPDVLHAHSTFHAGVVALRLGRRVRRPVVLTEHLSALVDPGWPEHEAEARILRDTFSRVDRALVVSTALRDALGRFGIDTRRVEVVPNMVAAPFFESVGLPQAPPALFTAGYLIPRKRVDLLLRAVAIVRRARPSLVLRIGGDGPERPRLEALARELGLDANVTFLGLLERAAVKRELDRCHVFALASEFETFGVVVAEALAAGRPVVATDSLGVRDVVGTEDGELVASSEPEALAAALERQLARSAGIEPRALSARCHARFAPEIVARRLLRIYEELAPASAARA